MVIQCYTMLYNVIHGYTLFGFQIVWVPRFAMPREEEEEKVTQIHRKVWLNSSFPTSLLCVVQASVGDRVPPKQMQENARYKWGVGKC